MHLRLKTGRRGVLAGAAALAACQAPPPAAPAPTEARLSPGGVGYIGLSGPIVNQMRDLFEAHVNQLLDQNARQIYVLLTSPGGVVSAVQDMIGFIERTRRDRGVGFAMHNMNAVASGACYLFLAGTPRLAVPRAGFLFHEVSMTTAAGAISSAELQQDSARAQEIERQFLAMLTSRTRLTPAEASSFVKRTVILNATEAQRDGIIDSIADFALPPGATLGTIRVFQRDQPANRPTPAPQP